MKFFQKKDKRPDESNPQPAKPAVDQSFYARHAGDAPLDEYFTGTGARTPQRTSRHSPVRIRENGNRESSKAISWLLLRTALIVVLIIAGFFALRLVLNQVAKPSKKELQQRETRAALMEKSGVATVASTPVHQDLVINSALITQRLEQWEQTERHLRDAEALNRRGIDEDAIQRLGQALRLTPNNREAQQMLLGIYMRRGLYAEAVPLCIRLLDENGRQPDLQINLLCALQASGQIDAGLVLADRMLQDQPNNPTVLSIAAAGQIAKGDAEAALTLFGRMLENDAKNISALEGCGKIYSTRGDYEMAVPYYLELVRLGPKPDYYRALARGYAQQQQAGKAIIFMGQAASLFGAGAISPWLKDALLDPIRETSDFRSFADRIVGIETRKAIEDINKREAEKSATEELAAPSLAPDINLKMYRKRQ